jgi:hypothetical protein
MMNQARRAGVSGVIVSSHRLPALWVATPDLAYVHFGDGRRQVVKCKEHGGPK